MPNKSVDLVLPYDSLIEVFGALPTRTYRGEWAPVGHRKTQYRQLSRDYAPVEKLDLSEQEQEVFLKYGLGDVVKFSSSSKDFKGEYFWFPREPNYTIHKANNPLGLDMIVVNAQQHMIGAWNIFFPLEQVFQHPVLVDLWYEKFSIEL